MVSPSDAVINCVCKDLSILFHERSARGEEQAAAIAHAAARLINRNIMMEVKVGI